MPAPRVFVSSSCYDLKYIRENLNYFIRSLGYEPILSEEGTVFYDPKLHVQDACLAEVPSCQIFILIIGGRYGGRYHDTDKSITNAEYEQAVECKVPIFALVERDVYDQYRVFLSNKGNREVDERKIAYPAVDSTRIFDFIEEVQGQSVNNALVPFGDFEDIQSYLKQQWASMMYSFLTSESEAKKIGSTIDALSAMSQKIEFFTRQVLQAVGDRTTKATVELYDVMIESQTVQDLTFWNLHPTPNKILGNETLQDFVGSGIRIEESDEYSIAHGGPPYRLSRDRFESDVKGYKDIRKKLMDVLNRHDLTLDEYLAAK
jgi:hypothetical protein